MRSEPPGGGRDPAGEPRTRALALKDAIAEAILTGAYRAGERLDEVSVAQHFRVSRTPVREALKQLAAMELVELRPHRGAFVAGLHPSRLSELFEAMGEVEAACARLAAVKMSRPEREGLEVAWAACDAALHEGHQDRIHAANQLFHAAIHAGAHNAFLAEAAQVLRRRLAPLSRAQFGLAGRPDHSAREHGAIMAAIRAGDGPGAEAAMRRHLASVGQAFAAWAAGGAAPGEA